MHTYVFTHTYEHICTYASFSASTLVTHCVRTSPMATHAVSPFFYELNQSCSFLHTHTRPYVSVKALTFMCSCIYIFTSSLTIVSFCIHCTLLKVVGAGLCCALLALLCASVYFCFSFSLHFQFTGYWHFSMGAST